jgi:hypothetical protein
MNCFEWRSGDSRHEITHGAGGHSCAPSPASITSPGSHCPPYSTWTETRVRITSFPKACLDSNQSLGLLLVTSHRTDLAPSPLALRSGCNDDLPTDLPRDRGTVEHEAAAPGQDNLGETVAHSSVPASCRAHRDHGQKLPGSPSGKEATPSKSQEASWERQ